MDIDNNIYSYYSEDEMQKDYDDNDENDSPIEQVV